MCKLFWLLAGDLERAETELAALGRAAVAPAPALPVAANDMLAQAKRLLRPGTLLVGDITVHRVGGRNSGDAGREDECRFTVIKEVLNYAFGGTTLYARHDAYSDSQFCTAELTLERSASTGDPEAAINFADGRDAVLGRGGSRGQDRRRERSAARGGRGGHGRGGVRVSLGRGHSYIPTVPRRRRQASIDLQRRALRFESRCTDELFRLRGEDFRFLFFF